MTTATFFKGDDEVLIVNEIILQDTKFCQHVDKSSFNTLQPSWLSLLPSSALFTCQTTGRDVLKVTAAVFASFV